TRSGCVLGTNGDRSAAVTTYPGDLPQVNGPKLAGCTSADGPAPRPPPGHPGPISRMLPAHPSTAGQRRSKGPLTAGPLPQPQTSPAGCTDPGTTPQADAEKQARSAHRAIAIRDKRRRVLSSRRAPITLASARNDRPILAEFFSNAGSRLAGGWPGRAAMISCDLRAANR